MSLRFAIIKQIATQIGQNLENVVFEWDEDQVAATLFSHLNKMLPKKKDPIFGEAKWTESEILTAYKAAWSETVNEFKKATIRIL